MSNTFITPTMVARDAAIAISNRLLVGNLVTRDKENLFTAAKRGDSVKVTVPPAVSDASEFTGTTVAGAVTETEVDLTLEKHFYKRVDLTTKEKSLELSDFTRLVTVPNVQGIQESIDKYFLRIMQVFRKNLSGTVGNRPSTVAHVAAANQKLNDLKVIANGRVALVDTTVEAALIQLPLFTSGDYGQDGPTALREAQIARRMNLDFFRDANLGAFTRSAAAGDITGTVLVDGTVAAGEDTLHIDGITNATGTIYAGTAFTIAGDATRYVVRKDATIADHEVDLLITPVLAAQATDEAAITFEAAGYSNLVYHPNAVAGAIVAPTPLAMGSAVESFNGVSIRVSMDSSIASLADSIVYDVFVGGRVIQPDGGALFCG
ncbi:MAG: P22 phage major capsid protein family protein [Kiritimatiellae bacterium]|nr:P22 phage major capsid protein family protein [Kiritimatiellia bacterium]